MKEEEKNIFSKYRLWQKHIEELNTDMNNSENIYTMCCGCGGSGCASCG